MLWNVQKAIVVGFILPCAMLLAQNQPIGEPQTAPATPAPAQQLLPPDQLDNLVAPIALYPDPLLGQVLAASTYPLEVVEAQQWLQQNRNLRGSQLMEAARQQNWDASVQALVAFPNVLGMMNRDVRWVSDLGNAYLAQQQDVMAAVQRMRVRAEQNGRLRSTSQENVTTEIQGGQSAVVIEPANPDVIYVPEYNPEYIWGPGYYPPLWYPEVGFGFGWGPGIYLGGFFPAWGGWGWGGWGLGWGWGCGWFGGRGIFVNNVFFNRYGFHSFYGGGFGNRFAGGRQSWQHDPFHRGGVPYANRTVASRFNNSRFAAGRANMASAGGNRFGVNRGNSFGGNGSRSFGSGAAGGGWNGGTANRSYNGSGYGRGYSSPNSTRSYSGQGNRGSASPGYSGGARSYTGPSRSYAAPSRSYAAPAPRSYAAPSGGGYSRSYGGGGRSYAAPSGGGSSRSYGGGGRSFSGGGGGGFSHSSGGGGGHSSGGGGGHSGGRR